jgi:hypothetical protein
VSPLLAEEIENGSATLLLVAGFAGGAVDLDGDDDGAVDREPWDALADAIAIADGDAGDRLPSFDGGTAPVGGASRIPDGADTDGPSDWLRNDFEGEGTPCASGSAPSGEALNTPGASNRELAPRRL